MNERKLFIDALRLPKSDERSAYLDGACGGDGEVRRQVEALLREHEGLGSFLETPAITLPETVVEPTVDERPGTVIGHYKLLEQLGEGGFGIVFLAEQQRPLRRQVAVKVLKPGMDSRQVIARFEAERQALALMDHPHIARVLDGGETATGRPYFVMDLVRGPPITEFCDRNQLTLKERLELFITVCQAVQHAHHKGIIHRDLKPSNVLVARHDDRPVVKVIDFGIAKALGRQASDPLPFTSHSLMLGTPMYMSPEQAGLRGLDMDTRSDIYSLGVLLYELLTGTTPLDKDRLKDLGYDELRRIIREEEPPKPSTRVNSLGPATPTSSTPAESTSTPSDRKRLSRRFQGDLDWIVMKALEKDRNRRFETADAFAEDLRRYLADEPVLSGPPGAGYRLRKFVRRNKGPVLAASAVLLALVVGFIGTGIGFVRAEAARREEARQRGIADEKEIRATTAERLAHQRLAEVIQQERRTAEEAAIAQAVSDFLQRDLLGQADIGKQAFLGGTAERIPNITVVELLDRAAKAVGRKFADQPLTEAAVRVTLGDTYQALGRFPEAQLHLERSVQLRTDKLGAHHPDTLISRNNLATLYVAQGKYDQAEPLFREVLEAHIAQLGVDHHDTLINKNNLARVFYAQEKYDYAESLFKEALGSGSISIAAADPILLVIKNNLGMLYTKQRKYDQAEPLFEELILAKTIQEGADHPSTLITKGNLAYLYYVQRKYDKAEPIYLEVIEAKTAKLGADHLQTLTSKNNLALLYLDQRKFAQAEPLLTEAVDVARGKPGVAHPNTQMFIRNLVECYENMGQPAQGERLLREQADFWKRETGADSSRFADQLAQLGWNLLLQGKGTDAEPVLRECVGIREKSDPDTWPTLDSVWMLGGALLLQGRHEAAEPLLLAGYEGMKRHEAKIPPQLKRRLTSALERLTHLYDTWGKQDEADKWRAKLEATKMATANETE